MCGITCEIIQPIFQPILDYMIMACMGNLGLIGIFPKIVDRLCPQWAQSKNLVMVNYFFGGNN